MYCPNCGTNLEEGAKFCPSCGAPIAQQAETTSEEKVADTVSYATQNEVNELAKETGKKNMILAIIGLALVGFFYTAIGGLVVSIIAKKKCSNYEEQFGEATGMAKVAKILSKLGFIFGIIASVAIVIYIVAIIAYSL